METIELKTISKKIELTTFGRCCTYLGIKPTLPDVSRLPSKNAKALVSNYKLWVIAEAWNKQDGFVVDYDNHHQTKYYAFFEKLPSDFAFRHSSCVRTFAHAGSGSRFCFKTDSRAKKFGEMFIGLHNDVLLIETK